jgi:DNA repair protein RadC
MPNGWKGLGSPDCSIDRTFIYQFNIQPIIKKTSTTNKTYRNPIFLAKEYKKMINLGEAKNQAELARIKGISRARVTQILNLLKLDKKIIDNLEQIGDPMDKKVISERALRKIIHY